MRRSSTPFNTTVTVVLALALVLSIFCSICDLAHAAECTTQQENTIEALNRNNARSSACSEYADLSPSSALFARICRDKSCVAVLRANIAKYPSCSVSGVNLKQALTLAWKECDRYSSLTSTPTPTTRKPTTSTSTTRKPTTSTLLTTTKNPSSAPSSSTTAATTRSPTPTTTSPSSLRTVTPTVSSISSIGAPLTRSGASASTQSVSTAVLASSLVVVVAYAATS